MPERIQLSRAKGWRMPENTVKVDRSTAWGNPHAVRNGRILGDGKPWCEVYFVGGSMAHFDSKDEAAAVSVATFERWIQQWPQHKLMSAAMHALAGKNLACWCKPGTPCHADVLLRLANAGAALAAAQGDAP